MKHESTIPWNGPAGRAWVATQGLLDRVFQPFEDRLVEAVAARRPRNVLDVGCGAGATTLAVARALGPGGHATGIDISEPMIAAAQARAGNHVSFVRADAQTHTFAPAGFDMVISRFGVMFFDDPVHAFENLRRATADEAELRFAAWRGPEENPFMTTAERAAAPLLPNLPPRQPGQPGQFAFAHPQRIDQILRESGWAHIDIQPLDVYCTFPEPDLVTYFTRLGPVGLALGEVDDLTRQKVIETLRAAFSPYLDGNQVHFLAACWMVSARRLTDSACLFFLSFFLAAIYRAG